MGYIRNNLAPDETIRAVVRVHWGILLPAAWALVVLAGAMWLGRSGLLDLWLSRLDIPVSAWVPIGILAAICLITTVHAVIYLLTTEIAITDRKVVAKWGLFARRTIEQRLSKIESVAVDQGILGRIFGFGSVFVHGTGSGSTPIRYVRDPLWVRREIQLAIEEEG